MSYGNRGRDLVDEVVALNKDRCFAAAVCHLVSCRSA